MIERRTNPIHFLILSILLFIFGVILNLYAQSELETQAQQAAHAAKVRYVTNALRRTELKDDEFLKYGREDVQSLAREVQQCWKELEKKK